MSDAAMYAAVLGGSPIPAPAAFGGTVRWYDSTDPLNLGGFRPSDGPFPQWANKIAVPGGNLGPRSGAPSTYPVYQNNAGDGLPTFNFTGSSSQGLQGAAVDLPTIYTMYLLIRVSAGGVARQKVLFNGTDQTGGSGTGYGLNASQQRTIFSATSFATLLENGTTSNDYELIAIQFDGTTNFLRLDNLNRTITNSTLGYTPPVGVLDIGFSRVTGVPSQYFTGEIREIIIRDVFDDSVIRTAFAQYFNDKWNLGLEVPNLISNLEAWYDSSETSTVILSGSDVTNWEDKAQQNDDLAQGTASAQPEYQATGVNGLPGILFDGVDDHLTAPSVSAFADVSHSWVFTLNPLGANTLMDEQWFSSFDNATNSELIGLENGTGFFQKATNSGTAILANNRSYNNLHFICAVTVNVTNSELRAYINGVLVATVSHTATAAINYVLGSDGTPLANFFNGYIQEVLFFDKTLGGGEVNQLTNYLQTKWNFQSSLLLENGGFMLLSSGIGGSKILLD